MPPVYRELLDRLRREFPQPVSDRVHDAFVAFSVLRALDRVDSLKGHTPILGHPVDPDFDSALTAKIAEGGSTLEGMIIWGHPQSQVNVINQPTIASVVGVLLSSVYNPNLGSDESGRGVSAAEVRVTSIAAKLIGYDAQRAGGVFTFGGTGAMLYGVKVGLEKAIPGALRTGLRGEAVVLASTHAHACCANVAAWLGIGSENVVLVPTAADNSILVDRLRESAREAIAAGKRIAALVATMGTTDAFGIDDLQAICRLRDELVEEFSLDYRPHVHADAVIGWAWSVFNDYDFTANPLEFRGRTVRALAKAAHHIRHLSLADSIGIDFHKTGYAPYVSTLVLFRDHKDLDYLQRAADQMPYLFHSGAHHPATFTLETTRSGAGPMSALANMLLFGKEGLRVLLGHVVEMAEALREKVEAHPDLTVLNGENVGAVTLFRVYPRGIDTFTIKAREQSDARIQEQVRDWNEYNRRIFQRVHAEALAGRGVVISMTDCYRHTDFGTPLAALKSYVLSPFADVERMDSIVDHVLRARDDVDQELRENA